MAGSFCTFAAVRISVLPVRELTILELEIFLIILMGVGPNPNPNPEEMGVLLLEIVNGGG